MVVGSGYWGALFPAAGKQSNIFRKQHVILKSNLAIIWHPIQLRNFTYCRGNHAFTHDQVDGKFLKVFKILKGGFSFETALRRTTKNVCHYLKY